LKVFLKAHQSIKKFLMNIDFVLRNESEYAAPVFLNTSGKQRQTQKGKRQNQATQKQAGIKSKIFKCVII